jgi:hypothetical protein
MLGILSFLPLMGLWVCPLSHQKALQFFCGHERDQNIQKMTLRLHGRKQILSSLQEEFQIPFLQVPGPIQISGMTVLASVQ